MVLPIRKMAGTRDSEVWLSVFSNPFTKFPISRKSKETVVVTNGNSLISVIRIADQKQLRSWSSKYVSRFTCPAVYNSVQDTYCVVQNGNLLRQWSHHDESIEMTPKVKFTDTVHTLLGFEFEEPIVVFLKGDCQLLHQAIASKKDSKNNYIQDDDICWVDGVYNDSGIYVALVTVNKQNSKKVLHCFRISRTDGNVEDHSVINLKKDRTEPLSWCLHQNQRKFLFLVLWSNGELHSYEYGNNLSNKFHCFECVKKYSSVAMCSLDSNHIAVISIPELEETIADPSFEIWDIKFSILKEKKMLQVQKRDIQMICLGQNIFIFDGKQLFGMECVIQSSSLVSVLGQQASSVVPKKDKDLIFRWTDEGIDFPYKNDNTEKEKMEWEESKALYLSQLESMRQTLSCLCEQSFPKLRDKSDIKVLANALEQWKHIPELELARTLQFCLRISDEYFKNHISSETVEAEDCPFSSEKATFLNKLLSLPFNDMFLQEHLLSIPFEDVTILLKYFLYLLKLEKAPEEKRPSIQEIVPWLCILIDSHFSNFILCKDSNIHQLLKEFVDVTTTMIEHYKDMEELEQLLTMISLQQNEDFEENKIQANSQYCIEILYM